MARILVLYYSSYGHIAQMADAVAEGVIAEGHEAVILRVPETAPREVAESAGFRVNPDHAEIEGPDALREFDKDTRFKSIHNEFHAAVDYGDITRAFDACAQFIKQLNP